jgi:hypothetical protein
MAASKSGFGAAWHLYEARSFIKLLGWVNIIWGVMACLTICGAVTGWVPIWMGICLVRSHRHLTESVQFGRPGQVEEAFKELAMSIKIQAIFMLISAIITGLMMLFYMGIFCLGILGGALAA